MKYLILIASLFLSSTGHSVVFSFDDGWKSVYTKAFPLFKQYGYTGTVSIAPSLLNTPGHMTWEEVLELRANGWEVYNHSLDHQDLTKLSPEEALNNVLEAQKIFIQHGIAPNTVVPPYGEVTPELTSLLLNHFKYIRMAWESSEYKDQLLPVLEVKHMKINDIKKRLIKDNHLILLLHKIGYTNDMNYSITEEELLDLLMFCFMNQIEIKETF